METRRLHAARRPERRDRSPTRTARPPRDAGRPAARSPRLSCSPWCRAGAPRLPPCDAQARRRTARMSISASSLPGPHGKANRFAQDAARMNAILALWGVASLLVGLVWSLVGLALGGGGAARGETREELVLRADSEECIRPVLGEPSASGPRARVVQALRSRHMTAARS